MENSIYITGICPHCSLALDYLPEDKSVFCHGCNNNLPTSALSLFAVGEGKDDVFEAHRIFAEGITSAEAGLIYTDNFLDIFDFASFAETEALSIPRLDAIAEAAKLKFSADYLTYVLDFKRIAVPFIKKIEGLEVLAVELAHKYRSDDISDLFEAFDLYSAITKKITAERDAAAKALLTDIRLAKKFGAKDEIIDDLEKSYAAFVDISSRISEVNDISEIEEYRRVKYAKDASVAENLRKAGIDAEKTYEKANALIEAGDIDGGLHLLLALCPYKNSGDYIKRYSSIFTFGEGLIEMAGKSFIRRNTTVAGEDGETYDTGLFALHPITNATTSESAALNAVSSIIATFGTKIFFIRNFNALCCFDSTSDELYANVRILDEGTGGSYSNEGKFSAFLSSDRSSFYIKKKLQAEEKRGIFGKKSAFFNTANNYSLIKVDMDGVVASTVIPEMIDIMDCFGDYIFYTAANSDGAYQQFRMLNLKTKEDREVLDANCVIHSVSEGKVIFSVFAPDRFNLDLYAFDIESEEKTLIAKNVRDFYSSLEDRIYYTVGGEDFNILYSSDFKGSEPTEIMRNAGRIISVRSGWIYYKSGEGINACLKKVSADGKLRTVIADRFEKLIKMANGYIYYVGRGNSLCIARCDGDGARGIAEGILADNIVIDDKNIYFLKKDYERGGEDILSLYSTDLVGKNLKKLAYNVSSLKEYTAEELFVSVREKRDFIVKTPTDKKNETCETVTEWVFDYCRINKASGKRTKVATVGSPKITYTDIKSGFLFFRKTKHLPSRVIPVEKAAEGYKREGVSSAGEVMRETMAKDGGLAVKKK